MKAEQAAIDYANLAFSDPTLAEPETAFLAGARWRQERDADLCESADEADRYRKASAEAYENWMTAASECNEKDAEIARLRAQVADMMSGCGVYWPNKEER